MTRFATALLLLAVLCPSLAWARKPVVVEGANRESLPAKARPKGPRFPFGLTPSTAPLVVPHLERCQSPDDAGTFACYIVDNSDFTLDVRQFHGSATTFRFVIADDGSTRLSEVTLFAGEIETCDAMAEALVTAIAIIGESYGKPQLVETGPNFGSSNCDHFKNEGRAFYRAEWKSWSMTVDSFWTSESGKYAVYLSIKHLPTAAIAEERRRLEDSRALEKL